MRRQPAHRRQPGIFDLSLTGQHAVAYVRRVLSGDRTNQRQIARRVGRHPVKFVVISRHAIVGIVDPVDLVRCAVLRDLTADGHQLLDFLHERRVRRHRHVERLAIVIVAAPIPILRHQADGERDLQFLQHGAQRLEVSHWDVGRNVLDAKHGAMPWRAVHPEDVVEHIGKDQRTVAELRRDHRHIRHDPEFPAPRDVRPRIARAVESLAVDRHLRGIGDLQPAHRRIELVFDQRLALVVDAGVGIERVLQQAEAVALLELGARPEGRQIPRVAPQIDAHPDEGVLCCIEVVTKCRRQGSLVPDGSDVEGCFIFCQVAGGVGRERLPCHRHIEVGKQVLQVQRINVAQPAELALVVVQDKKPSGRIGLRATRKAGERESEN